LLFCHLYTQIPLYSENTFIMAWFKRSSRFTPLVLAVALTLGLGVNVPAQVKAQSTPPSLGSVLGSAFRAPRTDTPAPENREPGATRGPCVMTDKFAALVPLGGGNTTAEYPTIYWYMPQLIAEGGTITGSGV
jgi:hypothetical protein